MARGFLKGAMWGVGVSLIGVALLSVIEDMPDQPRAVGLAAGSSVGQQEPGANRGRNGDGPSLADVATADVAAPEPDTLSELVAEALSPAAVPEAGDASDLNGTSLPQDTAMSGVSAGSGDAPSVQYSQSDTLQTPATEPGFSISTDPAQPTAPEAMPQETAFADPETPAIDTAAAQEAAPDSDTQLADSTSDPAKPAPAPESVAAAAQDLAQPEAPATAPEASAFAAPGGGQGDEPDLGAADTEIALATGVDALPVPAGGDAPAQPLSRGPELAQSTVQPAQAPMQIARALPNADRLTASEAPVATPTAELPNPDSAGRGSVTKDSASAPVEAEVAVVVPEAAPQLNGASTLPTTIAAAPERVSNSTFPTIGETEIVVPATVSNTAEKIVSTQAAPAQTPRKVRVNRLPTLGTDPQPEDTEEQEVEAAAVEPEEDDAHPGTPVARYAATFEPPEGKPLMAVVLMDQGAKLDDPQTGLDAVRALPYPVSFAVDALAPDAAARMAEYRAAGFEVLAMIDLPSGATATDAEVNVSAALETLPEVIGVLEGTETGVQTTAMAGRQVADILAQTGHGLVTQNRGLNTVQKLAARQGVPSNIVFRDFDGKNQSEPVIRRFMDQAALRAGQDGGVVMLGRLREDTLAALLSWSLQDRASTVAMAPVSAVLLQEQGS